MAYYARVSTDKEEQKTSIEHQWTFFEQLISDVKNWTLVDGYIDEGISGITVTHREEFQRMLQDAKAGKIDLIITKEITRFARNVLDSIRYTRELLDCGTAVWFRNDNINTLDDLPCKIRCDLLHVWLNLYLKNSLFFSAIDRKNTVSCNLFNRFFKIIIHLKYRRFFWFLR